MDTLKPYGPLLAWVLLILVLPALGAWAGGHPLGDFLHLPLARRDWDPLPYSPRAYLGAFAGGGLVVALALWLGIGPGGADTDAAAPAGRLPRWSWTALSLLVAAPFAAAGPGYWPLLGQWLFLGGLLGLLNADLVRRIGHAPLLERPGYFLSLLPAGVLLGGLCRYLDLFVQTWTYPGLAHAGPLGAALAPAPGHALLLPLLLTLRQWLASHPRLLRRLTHGRPIAGTDAVDAGWVCAGVAALSLAATGIWPDRIYFLTWLAPLLLAIGLPLAAGKATIFSGLRHGDWSRLLLTCAAALLLGLLELAWNAAYGPFWNATPSLLQGPALAGLPLPGLLFFPVIGMTGLWLADQLITPWRKHPKRRFPKFPIKVVIK